MNTLKTDEVIGMKTLKEKMLSLQKRAKIRKSTYPSVKTDKDVIAENKHAADLMPFMYRQIVEMN